VKGIIEIANNKKVPVIWRLSNVPLCYYYAKQFGFYGVSLHNVIQMKNAAAAGAVVSVTGATSISVIGVITLSFTSTLFLSLLASYIPYGKAKTLIRGTKVLVGLPIFVTEFTLNAVTGFVEKSIFGSELPINVTDVDGLMKGPKLKDLPKIKKSLFERLMYLVQDL